MNSKDDMPKSKNEEVKVRDFKITAPKEKKFGAGVGEKVKKHSWLLAIIFLFVFLAGGGYYFSSLTKLSAFSLAGGAVFSDSKKASAPETASNVGSSFDATPEPFSSATGSGFGTSDENGRSDEQIRNGLLKEGVSSAYSVGTIALATSVSAEKSSGAYTGAGTAAEGNGSGNGAGTAADGNLLTAGNRGDNGDAAFASNKDVVQGVKKNNGAGGKNKEKGKGGIMDALRDLFSNSKLAAMTGSKDTARSLAGKNFNNSKRPGYSLDYGSESAKRELDALDPEAVTEILRTNANINAANIDPSQVDTPKTLSIKGTSINLGQKTGMLDNKSGGSVSDFLGTFGSGSASQNNPFSLSNSNIGDATSDSPQELGAVDDDNTISFGNKDGEEVLYNENGSLDGCRDNENGYYIPAGSPGCSL